MKKIIAVLMTVICLAMCLAACGSSAPAAAPAADSDLAYVQGKGTLVVGITDYAPMDFKDENGNWTGFDAEFAEMVAEKLGVSAEFIEIDWDNKYFELNAKTIDCIWNGMTICDEVNLNTSCSSPYVKNAQVVVVPADKAADYATVESIADLKFAVEAGSAGEAALEELGITNVIAVQAQSNALMEVAAGTADACVIDITMANAMTGEGTGYANLTASLELTAEEYGIGFRKDSDLTAKVNELMAAMMNDGSLDALAAKYELTLVK